MKREEGVGRGRREEEERGGGRRRDREEAEEVGGGGRATASQTDYVRARRKQVSGVNHMTSDFCLPKEHVSSEPCSLVDHSQPVSTLREKGIISLV